MNRRFEDAQYQKPAYLHISCLNAVIKIMKEIIMTSPELVGLFTSQTPTFSRIRER